MSEHVCVSYLVEQTGTQNHVKPPHAEKVLRLSIRVEKLEEGRTNGHKVKINM